MHAAHERRLMRQILESNKLNSLYNQGLKFIWGCAALSTVMQMYKDLNSMRSSKNDYRSPDATVYESIYKTLIRQLHLN